MPDTTLRDLVLKRLDADTQPEGEWSALVPAARGAEPRMRIRGVSTLVSGRRREGIRVRYDTEKGRGASERVVMERCRRAGYKCLRLPPAIWHAMGRLQGLERQHPGEDPTELLRRLGSARPTLMRVGLVSALRGALTPAAIEALVARHSSGDADRRKWPGVPDLFVFRPRPDGTLGAARFVEVKRPDEDLAPHQQGEIEFMRSIGLRAGVLRLSERGRKHGGRKSNGGPHG